MKGIETLMERMKQKNNVTYMPIGSFFFLLVFAVLLMIHCIENTSLVYQEVQWIGWMYWFKKVLYIALVYKIVFLSSYRLEHIPMLVLCLGTALLSYRTCGDPNLLEFVLIVIASKNVDAMHTLRVFMAIKCSSIFLTLAGWKFGILPELLYQNGMSYYNTLGFCHRNVLGANLAAICLVWFYLRFDRIKWGDIALWTGIGLSVYYMVHSRTSVFIILLTIYGSIFYKWAEKSVFAGTIPAKAVCSFFVFLVFISIAGTVFYKESSVFWRELDSLFTRRFSYASYCYNKYGFTLFGQKIPFISSIQAQMSNSIKLILDNAYMRIILYHGIVPAVLYMGSYLWILCKAAQLKNSRLVFVFLIMGVYGLSERYMIDIYYHVLFITAIQLFWGCCHEVHIDGNDKEKFYL